MFKVPLKNYWLISRVAQPKANSWWLLPVALVSILLWSCSAPSHNDFEFKAGDIILQGLNSTQCDAVREATGSFYSHCGIVMEDQGELLVYQAIGPVIKSSISEFTNAGIQGHYVVLRATENNPVDFDAAKTYCDGELGKNYDIYFNWDDSEQYCSELVWKAYKAGGLALCETKPLRSYNLSSALVQMVMQERYGDQIPLDEPMIAPGDFLDASTLESVYEYGQVETFSIRSDSN